MNKSKKCFQYFYYRQIVDNKKEVFKLKKCFIDLGLRVNTKDNHLTADCVPEDYLTSDEEFKYVLRSDTESYDSEDNGFETIVDRFNKLIKPKNRTKVDDKDNPTKKMKKRCNKSQSKTKPKCEPMVASKPEPQTREPQLMPQLIEAEESLLEDDFYTTNMQLFLSQSMTQMTQSSALMQQNGSFSYFPSIGSEDRVLIKDESIKVSKNVDSLLSPLMDIFEETDWKWTTILTIIPEYMFAFRMSSKSSILLAHKMLSHYNWSEEKKTMNSVELSHFKGVHNEFMTTFMREILLSCFSRDHILCVISGTDDVSNGWPFVSKLIAFNINELIKKSEDLSMAFIHLKLIVEVLVNDFKLFLSESNDYCNDIQQHNSKPIVCRLIWTQKRPNYLNSVCKQLVFLITKILMIKENDLLLIQSLKLFELCAECLRIGSGNVRPFVTFAYNKSTPITELYQQLCHQTLATNEVFEKLLNGLTISWIKLHFCAQFMTNFIIDLKNKYLSERQKRLSLKVIVECLTNAKLLSKQSKNQTKSDSQQKLRTSCGESPQKRLSINLVDKPKALTRKEWSKKSKYGENSLHMACIRGQTDKLKQLLQLSIEGFGPNPNDIDHIGYTPLCEAAINGHMSCIQALIEWQNRSNQRLDFESGPNKQTALHDAIENNFIDCVKLIIESGGQRLLDIERDIDGKAPKDLIKSEEMRQMIESLKNRETFRPKINIKCLNDSNVFVRNVIDLIVSYIETTKMNSFIDCEQDLWQNIFNDVFKREINDTDLTSLIEDLAVVRKLPKIISNLKKLFDNSSIDVMIDDFELALNLLVLNQ